MKWSLKYKNFIRKPPSPQYTHMLPEPQACRCLDYNQKPPLKEVGAAVIIICRTICHRGVQAHSVSRLRLGRSTKSGHMLPCKVSEHSDREEGSVRQIDRQATTQTECRKERTSFLLIRQNKIGKKCCIYKYRFIDVKSLAWFLFCFAHFCQMGNIAQMRYCGVE